METRPPSTAKHHHKHQQPPASPPSNGPQPNGAAATQTPTPTPQKPATKPASSRATPARPSKRVAPSVERQRQLDTRRASQLSWCLLCLVGAALSLTPGFLLSLHLSRRVGLLIFESDLLLLRSSLYTNVILVCFLLLLVPLLVLAAAAAAGCCKSTSHILRLRPRPAYDYRRLQRTLKVLTISGGLVSALSYLGLALLVPPVRQVQRLPLATFDCNANLIVLENCHQQFVTRQGHGEQGLVEALELLFARDVAGEPSRERLLDRLGCPDKFQHQQVTADVGGGGAGASGGRHHRRQQSVAPTRFLLDKCGLVCRPHRQQVHQFGDDLNAGQTSGAGAGADTAGVHYGSRPWLVPPYSSSSIGGQLHNGSTSDHQRGGPLGASSDYDKLSIKVCFLGETGDATGTSGGSAGISGSGSAYKRFCIENLTNRGRELADTSSGQAASGQHHQRAAAALTVGQLNSMLAKITRTTTATTTTTGSDDDHDHNDDQFQEPDDEFGQLEFRGRHSRRRSGQEEPQDHYVTHYVNPIVQFESHFKQWPAPSGGGAGGAAARQQEQPGDGQWCKFKPIPPFIVNNKPFSDIQCSLEHEYTVSQPATSNSHEDRHHHHQRPASIYLRRRRRRRRRGTSGPEDVDTNTLRERCNIQCKLNLLYQVRLGPQVGGGSRLNQASTAAAASDSYYLPLRPCLLVAGGGGDKAQTFGYYLALRTTGDSGFLLCLIMVDLLLLLESTTTTGRFYLGGRRARLVGLVVASNLVPLLVACLFDLAARYWPQADPRGRDGYLTRLLGDHLLPGLWELADRLRSLVGLLASQANSSELASQSGTARARGATRHQEGLVAGNRTLEPAASLMEANSDSRAGGGYADSTSRLDKYMIPFLVYAIFMFALVVNAIRLPSAGPGGGRPLVRVTSSEELGLQQADSDSGRGEDEDGQPSAVVASSSPPADQREAERLARAKTAEDAGRSRLARRATLFVVLTLFLGLQFNLSQLAQQRILVDSFGDLIRPELQARATAAGGHKQQDQQHEQLQQQQQQQQQQQHSGGSALVFSLATQSGGPLLCLLLVLLFGDELSSFLADFAPPLRGGRRGGRPRADRPDWRRRSRLLALDQLRSQQSFQGLVAISLLVYSVRFLILANITPRAGWLRWPLVLMFQLGELLNFPLTWFVLALRCHQLLAWSPSWPQSQAAASVGDEKPGVAKSQTDSEPTTTADGHECRPLLVQLGAQASMGLVYFGLGRLLALFVHSLHASLHLHSNNIDWLMLGFYGPTGQPSGAGAAAAANRTTAQSHARPAPPGAYDGQLRQEGENEAGGGGGPRSLFTPLPSEQQSYLHASRLFIKYNSLVCLLLGLLFLCGLLHTKWRLWREAGRLAGQRHRQHQQQQHRLASGRWRMQGAKTAPSGGGGGGGDAAVVEEQQSDLIDERLSWDLMRIHRDRRPAPRRRQLLSPATSSRATKNTVHYPASGQSGRPFEEGHGQTRARIHFHYDVGPIEGPDRSDDGSSASSASSSSSSSSPKGDRRSWQRRRQQQQSSRVEAEQPDLLDGTSSGEPEEPQSSRDDASQVGEQQRHHPLASYVGSQVEEEPQEVEVEEEIVRTSSRHSRRVLRFERVAVAAAPASGQEDDDYQATRRPSALPPADQQQEAEDCMQAIMEASPPPPQFADNTGAGVAAVVPVGKRQGRLPSIEPQQQPQRQRRRITFAPETTIIRASQQQQQQQQREQRDGSRTDGQSASAHGGGQRATRLALQQPQGAAAPQTSPPSGPQRASPEPSIDGDDDDHDDEPEDDRRDNYELGGRRLSGIAAGVGGDADSIE